MGGGAAAGVIRGLDREAGGCGPWERERARAEDSREDAGGCFHRGRGRAKGGWCVSAAGVRGERVVKGRERYVHVDLVKKGENASARWLTVVAGRHKGGCCF